MKAAATCTDVVEVLLDDGLVEASRLLELVLLHEEHVRHVELPGVVLVAELDRLAEDLLHLRVVLHVPVDLRLLHQHRDVPARPRDEQGLGVHDYDEYQL